MIARRPPPAGPAAHRCWPGPARASTSSPCRSRWAWRRPACSPPWAWPGSRPGPA